MSVVFFSTKVEAKKLLNVYPKRRITLTIKYVDYETNKEIAQRLTVKVIHVRKLQFEMPERVLSEKGPWTPEGTYEKYKSPDLTALGYTIASEDVVDPVKITLPKDSDVRESNLNYSQTFSVKYRHRVVTATAEKPGDPLSPLEESRPDGPKWPTGTTKDALTQSVYRTIQYQNQETKTTLLPERSQQVDYTRNADVDAVTGKFLGYSTWCSTNPIFAAVNSPKLAGKGYKLPNPLTVPELETKVSDKARSVIVNYEPSKVAIEAKNSTMIAGPTATWSPKDNFRSAKDQNGDAVDFKDIKVDGDVDATKVGKYDISYSYTDENSNTVTKPIVVDVVASKLSLDVKDSIISVNSTSVWSPKDNFISATDQDGKPLDIKQVDVTGSVDTTKPGKYDITYSYTDSQGNKIVKKSTVTTVRRLTFKDVPEVLAFNESKVTNHTTEVSRKNPNWKMIVEDSREEKSPWRITAKLTSPFKNSLGESALGDILLYRKANQADQWINSTNEVTVFDGRSNKDMDQYDVSWSQNEGPLIKVAPGTVKASDYTSIIQWNLTDAPV